MPEGFGEKLISIVTINLNDKVGLERSIRSVISQNACDFVEHIIIDGNSSDGSSEVINHYRHFFSQVLDEGDDGIFDAMNKGISCANGRYLYFLNAGDSFASVDVLTDVIDVMRTADQNILYGAVEGFRYGKSLGIVKPVPWLVHQGAFVRTDIMRRYQFDVRFKVFGDLDLWQRLLNDGLLLVRTIDCVIAKMEMDGVGSSPRYIFMRLKDKKLYAKKYKKYLNLAFSYCIGTFGFLIYKSFGEKIYFSKYNNAMGKLKGIFINRYGD